jgi:hypothetical protein
MLKMYFCFRFLHALGLRDPPTLLPRHEQEALVQAQEEARLQRKQHNEKVAREQLEERCRIAQENTRLKNLKYTTPVELYHGDLFP